MKKEEIEEFFGGLKFFESYEAAVQMELSTEKFEIIKEKLE